MSSCKEVEVGESDAIMTLRCVIGGFVYLFFYSFSSFLRYFFNNSFFIAWNIWNAIQVFSLLFCNLTSLCNQLNYLLSYRLSSIMKGIYTHILYSCIFGELLSYSLLPVCVTATWVDFVSFQSLEGGGNHSTMYNIIVRIM